MDLTLVSSDVMAGICVWEVWDEKAEMIAQAFVEVQSSANLSEEGQRERKTTRKEHPGVLDSREDVNDVLNTPFTMAEVKGQ